MSGDNAFAFIAWHPANSDGEEDEFCYWAGSEFGGKIVFHASHHKELTAG